MRQENEWEAVGRRIREARFLLGNLKQTDFGKFLGEFSAMQISNSERGKNPPPAELLTALARSGINVNYILTGEGSVWLKEMVRLEHPISPEELEGVLETLERYRQTLQGLSGARIPQPREVIEEARRRMVESRKGGPEKQEGGS